MARHRTAHVDYKAEFAWIHQPVDPSFCGCRHHRCCKESGHEKGQCRRAPTVPVWTFRQEYRCGECNAYMFGESRSEVAMTVR